MTRLIENMENRNGPTYTANAFKKAKEMFQDPSSGSRPNADKFVVLLYDGLSTDRFDLHAEAVRLKSQRIKIIPIGIGSSVAHTELINVADAKDYAFAYEQYKHALSRLIVSTIGESCSNHAFNKQADVIFLLDVKQKQSKDGFNNRRDLIKKILEYLFGWNFDLRIALATYSDYPMFIATLGWSSDLNELIRVSVVLEKSSNSTFSRTAEALKFVGDEGFSRSVSDRTKARKLVLLLTDGEWDSPGEIKKVVKDLKSRNISVVGIASGEDVNSEQFSFILSDPSQLIFIPEYSKYDLYVSLNALNTMTSFYSCDVDIFE